MYCASWSDSDTSATTSLKINLANSAGKILIPEMSTSTEAINYIAPTTTYTKANCYNTGKWFYFEQPVYVDEAWFNANAEAGGQYSFRFDSWGKQVYYVDSIQFAKVDGTNYSLVRIGDMSAGLGTGSFIYQPRFELDANNNFTFDLYNFNSAYAKLRFRCGFGYAAGDLWKYPAPHAKYTFSKNFADATAWNDNDDTTNGGAFIHSTPMGSTSATKADSGAFGLSGAHGWRIGIDITKLSYTDANSDAAFFTTVKKYAVIKSAVSNANITNPDPTKGNVWFYANAEGMYTAKATAYAGYTFAGWYDKLGRCVSTEATIETYADKQLTAKFVDPNAATYDIDAAEKNLISDDLSNFDALEVGATVPLDVANSVGAGITYTVVEDAEKGKVVSFTAPSTYQSPVWRLGDTLRELDAALGGGKTMRISISADVKSSSANDAFKLSVRSTAANPAQITSANYADINGNMGSYNIPANTWTTVNWVIDITPELLGTAVLDFCFETVIRSNAYKNSTVSIDNVVVKYVPTPQNQRVLEVDGEGVTINGVAESAVWASEGNTYKIALNDDSKVLVGVKYANGTTVIPAVNGVVDFLMPNSDVTLELITQDKTFVPEKNEITIIAGNGTIIKTVENATDIPAAPARLGYTIEGYSVNGAATVATLADAQAAAQALLDAGTKQIAVKYVYTKNASDKTVISVNGEKSTVAKLQLVTFATPAVKDGVPFAYWADANGNIVSYNRILAVYPTSNLYVNAVYAAEVVKEDYFELTGFTKNADQSISLVSNRNMGASTLVKHGLRLVSSLKQLSDAEATSVLGLGDVLGGTKRYTVWAGATNPVGTFVASKTSADSNLFWYAAAIYKVEGGADYVISNYKELTPNQVESALATFDDVDGVDQLVALGLLTSPTSAAYSTSIAEEDGNKFFKISFADRNASGDTWSAPSFNGFRNYITEAGTYTFSFRVKIVSTGATEVGNFGLKLVGANNVVGTSWRDDTTGTYKTDFFNGCNRPTSGTANAQVYHDVAGNIGATSEWETLSYTWTITDADLNTFIGQNWDLTFHMLNKNAHDLCIDDITIVKGENVNF